MYVRARKLAAASLVVMAGFVASRVLGLVRNIIVAQQFGTGREYEAFVAAITVPDLVFQVLAGGAVGSAFIPVFKSYFARDEEDQAWRLTSTMMSLAVLATGPVALVLMIFARQVAELIVPGWDPASKDLTATLMRTMLISPVIFSVSGFATSVLNSFQRFALAALAPIFYNASIIASALFFRPLGIEGVAIGVAVGAVLHLLIQVPGLVSQGMRFSFSVDLGLPGAREVIRLMGPRMVGLGVVQINQLVNVVLASYLVLGSLGYLNVAWLITMTPLVLAMAVSTAVFPTLAEESARERSEAVSEVFLLSLRTILFLTVPMAVGLITLGEPLIRLLFERGEFTDLSTRMTAHALNFYALGLAGHATVEIVDRVFYALHDTRTPVLVASGAFVLNLVLSLVLMRTPLNYGGLALANALAALAEGFVLMTVISRRVRDLDLGSVARSLARTVMASILMGITIATLPQVLEDWLSLSRTIELSLVVIIVAAAGAAVYLTFAFLLRSDEITALLRLARSRG
ncbi:MAG TPA: murein biosynthesis integral membrane protein MurJ [Chloroflexota bacterium]|nr:murein biosynthesis integral membrane protein MurJ [Chloroflexota bacterium]